MGAGKGAGRGGGNQWKQDFSRAQWERLLGFTPEWNDWKGVSATWPGHEVSNGGSAGKKRYVICSSTRLTKLRQAKGPPNLLAWQRLTLSLGKPYNEARKAHRHCWHTLPLSSRRHFITGISLSWCLTATSTSVYGDVNYRYIHLFYVALKSRSKINHPSGPHNIPEQQVPQYIYYLLLRAAKDFNNFHHIPPQLPLSWTEEVSPLNFFFCGWRLHLHSSLVPSLVLPFSSAVIRTRTTTFKRHLPRESVKHFLTSRM